MDDRTTEIRADRAASRLEDSQPATDLTKRVVHGITDVEPEELTAVVVGVVIKRRSGDVGADLLDGFLIHIGVEDEANLERCRVISGIDFPSITVVRALLNVRILLNPPSRRAVSEARKLQINQVIEPLERTLHTKRSDKLTRGGITDVVTQIAVLTEQIAGGFGRGDKTKHGSPVLFSEGVMTGTIADELNTQNVELILRELRGRSRDRGVRGSVERIRNRGSVDGGGRVGGTSHVTGNNLGSDTHVFATAAVIQNGLGELGELFNSLGNLTLDLERRFKIVQADARGLVCLGLQLPSASSLTKGQIVRHRIATRDVVGLAEASRGGDVRPVVFKLTGKDALNGEFRQGRAHAHRELPDAHQAAPRPINAITLLNVDVKAVCFPLEQIIHRGATNSARHSVDLLKD